MDPTSQRAVEGEVESHAPLVADVGGRGEPAPPVQEVPVQPQQALFQQMTKFFRQMTGAIPQPQPQPPPPPPQRSHLEKLRKYGAVDFLGKKEDDPMTAEN